MNFLRVDPLAGGLDPDAEVGFAIRQASLAALGGSDAAVVTRFREVVDAELERDQALDGAGGCGRQQLILQGNVAQFFR